MFLHFNVSWHTSHKLLWNFNFSFDIYFPKPWNAKYFYKNHVNPISLQCCQRYCITQFEFRILRNFHSIAARNSIPHFTEPSTRFPDLYENASPAYLPVIYSLFGLNGKLKNFTRLWKIIIRFLLRCKVSHITVINKINKKGRLCWWWKRKHMEIHA